MFSYLSPEERVPKNHPLRAIREFADRILRDLSPRFETMYSEMGRPSVAPEKLLRALLVQVLYTVRSERLLMEELNYNLLFRWFVGLNMDDAVGIPRSTPRTGTDCWKPTWPRSSSGWWWPRPLS